MKIDVDKTFSIFLTERNHLYNSVKRLIGNINLNMLCVFSLCFFIHSKFYMAVI